MASEDTNDNSEYFDFEEVLERINNLEIVVAKLINPELAYKRPGAEEYEKLTDTLDYLHTKVSELENKRAIHTFTVNITRVQDQRKPTTVELQ